MSRTIRLRKGYDIPLTGKAENKIAGECNPVRFGIRPVDFPGLTPKLEVKPGEKIKSGTPLFHDKKNPDIKYTSPVSGTVISVERGERRKIVELVIEKSGNDYINFGSDDPASLSREKIIEKLLPSGLWPAVRQRPYHVVANPADKPKSVFITGFDTSPLGPDYDFIMDNSPAGIFEIGISAISKLTGGKVNLVLKKNASKTPGRYNVGGVDISYFSGPHPAGNVGVHIHHLDPVNKGELVWYVNFQDVFAIGSLFAEGIYKPERLIALTGSEVINPQYYRGLSGCSIAPMIRDNIKSWNLRYISGNVLTGTKIKADGHLGYYDSQVTVIPEGDKYEFFGWALPGVDKLSFSRAFLSGFLPEKRFTPDTNMHGGERAFVVTGLYEKVLPMDIYPMHLLKAILAEDIDLMENLGIYEVAEEDFALCEFICPSKIEIQSVIRKGLDLMIKEMI